MPPGRSEKRPPESTVNLRAFHDPRLRILDSAGNSKNDPLRSYVNLRVIGDPRPRFLDSVGNSENNTFSFYVNLRVIDDPTMRFLDSVGGSEKRPRLSLERDATFVPKVSYFTVHVFAGSHRSRAGAP